MEIWTQPWEKLAATMPSPTLGESVRRLLGQRIISLPQTLSKMIFHQVTGLPAAWSINQFTQKASLPRGWTDGSAGKGAHCQAWGSRFDPWKLRGEWKKKKRILTTHCPLTSARHHSTGVCSHCTQEKKKQHKSMKCNTYHSIMCLITF